MKHGHNLCYNILVLYLVSASQKANIHHSSPRKQYFKIIEWKRDTRTMARDSSHRLCIDSFMHGHHIYKDIWSSSISKELQCQWEVGNIHDIYAVSVVKTIDRRNTFVGHLPRQTSTICHLFLRKGGIITCTISGRWQYLADLPQGGLELPC